MMQNLHHLYWLLYLCECVGLHYSPRAYVQLGYVLIYQVPDMFAVISHPVSLWLKIDLWAVYLVLNVVSAI